MISRARERRRRRHIIFGKGAALNSVTVGKTVSRRAFVEYRRFSHASLINTANLTIAGRRRDAPNTFDAQQPTRREEILLARELLANG